MTLTSRGLFLQWLKPLASRPNISEPVHDSDMDIYEKEMKLHEQELETIKYTKNEKMTIKKLLNILQKTKPNFKLATAKRDYQR